MGSVTLRVACSRRLQNGPDETYKVRFAVEDTGIGIPKEKSHRLFERFSQVNGTIQRDFGGTGLGLAISKRLVELMGGEIGVRSLEGSGSTFWFTAALPVASREDAAVIVAPISPMELEGLRILLVEDVEINQELARAVLERVGHQVDVAADGTEAIVAVQTKQYDLVLMDIQMPGMDGITATRHIRAMDHPSSILPIIAMTANVLPQQIAHFREVAFPITSASHSNGMNSTPRSTNGGRRGSATSLLLCSEPARIESTSSLLGGPRSGGSAQGRPSRAASPCVESALFSALPHFLTVSRIYLTVKCSRD